MIIDFDDIRGKINNGTYPKLGSGSGRRVFDLRNGYVVKVAKNQKGIAQNEMEYRISREYNSRIIAEVIFASDDFKFLIMKKAERVYSMSFITSYYQIRNLDEIMQVDDVRMLVDRFDLVRADLHRKSSWGMIDGRPVIIDYGYTRHIRAKYYKGFR